MIIRTFKYRVKSNNGWLNRQSRKVNFVWNYVNATQKKVFQESRKYLSRFDLQSLTSGASKELDLYSQTIQEVCKQYTESRITQKRGYIRFRGKRSLGWIPLNQQSITHKRTDTFDYSGKSFRVFYSRPIPQDAKIKGSSFSQDAKKNWYLNVCLALPEDFPCATEEAVGIDLGLKTLATLSTGEKIEAKQIYRQSEQSLGIAQRAHKKIRVTAIHRKIVNQRKDFLHKETTKIVNRFKKVFVGDVSSKWLTKTKAAKSVLDAGWGYFRNMLHYKAIARKQTVLDVSERFTTQACSQCGSLGGPKGIAGLGIREWVCLDCHALHDRDVNSALLILRLGLQTPAGGILAL